VIERKPKSEGEKERGEKWEKRKKERESERV